MERQVTLQNESGLHARPASLFVAEANKFQSQVSIVVNEKKVDAKSILGLLTLGVPKGQSMTIVAEGADEEIALQALGDLVENGFGE